MKPASLNLLDGPLLSTLLRLSLPNTIAMLATALVSVAETAYVGQLGTSALAGMALVFPFVMLQQMLSAGALGGGISSAISRALGHGHNDQAQQIAWHAVMIALGLGALSTAIMLWCAAPLFQAMGAHPEVQAQALAYAQVAFAASVGTWLLNAFASVARGAGQMRVPSVTLLVVALMQVGLGGVLGLGWLTGHVGGMPGVAMGMALSQCAGAVYLGWVVTRPNASLRLRWQGTWQGTLAAPILKIGGVSSVSSLQTVATIVIVTHWVARMGTEALAGYGIGSRLEFLLVPFTFAIGVSCLPMVGMALGAGRVQQARRVAWMGAALSAAWVGGLGLLVVIWPDAWSRWFTDQPQVLAVAADYFTRVAPFYGWFALGLCLYFASQGAGRMWGPVLAGTLRLVMVAVGGWWLSTQPNPQANDLFWLIGLAMLAYGLFAAISVKRTPWD